jgi:hypothetical protein
MYLAVRSFARKEAFLFRQWYGRVANRPYDAAAEHDHHAHFTVPCYDPDEATRSQQVPAPSGVKAPCIQHALR